MKRAIFIWVLLWCSQVLQAQQFIVKSYDYNNGLISGANRSTLQDSTGFYWTCCYGGLVRFDGQSFKTFRNSEGLIHYNVNTICETSKNQFLIGNQFDLLRFDGKQFHEIKTNAAKGTIFDHLYKLSNGHIVVNTNHVVLEIKQDSICSVYKLLNHNLRYLHAYQNIVWAITEDNQLIILQNDQLKQRIDLPKKETIEELSNLGEKLLLKTNEALYILEDNHFRWYTPDGMTEKLSLRSVYLDRKGRTWFTDQKNQVWIKTGSHFQNLSLLYNTKEVIEPKFLEDKNGNMVITSVYGMTIYKESNCKEIIIQEINNTNYNYLLYWFGQDTLLCGINKHGLVLSAKGLKVIKPVKLQGFSLDETTVRCDLFPMEEEHSFILRIANKGLFVYKNNEIKPYGPLLKNHTFLKGYYDLQEHCYFTGDSSYLFKIYLTRVDSFATKDTKGLIINSFHKLSNGSILFSGTHEELFLYSKNKIINLTPQLKTTRKTFSTNVNKNKIWVIIHGVEIQEYEIQDTQLIYLRRIAKEDGLPDANINDIVFDEQDNMWLNTFSGVYFLKLRPKTNEVDCRKIDLYQGSTNAPMINGILYKNQHLYAIAIGSILDIDTKDVLKNIAPYATYFSAIKVNNVDIETLQSNHIIDELQGKYVFPNTYNSILFQCNSVYFGYDDAIQYQYKLDDEDENWKNLNSSHTIHYTNLASGHYNLQVRSMNKLNPSVYTAISFEFTIKPPFWKSWWFRGLLTLLSLAIIFIFIKRRDALKEKENKIALKISELKLTALQSQMNPHFLFNSLNSIQNYIMQQKPIDAARYLSKFSKLMRRILDQSFNNLCPLDEIIETIEMYLELEAFRFKNEFDWKVEVDTAIQKEKIKLPPMIIQPFVENAIIHGLMPKVGAKLLRIHFYLENQLLICRIEDNGVGRNPQQVENKTHISRGQKLTTDMLSTMENILHKQVDIQYIDKKDSNQNPSGTIVQITIPQ